MRGAARFWMGLAVLALALALAGPAQAQDSDALGEFESWVTLDDEYAPDPPWVKLSGGFLGWIETRSDLEVEGTNFRDLETNQGLDSGGGGGWMELSIGQKIRGGVDGVYIKRLGDLAEQDQLVVVDGNVIANPGDSVKTSVSFFTVGLLLEWDALYGKTYRIGLLGGVRYFHTRTTIRGFTSAGTQRVTSGGELVSPFFGGRVQLTPFQFFSVFTRVQFMNWSWHDVGLKEARFFEFRLGAAFHLVPDALSVSLEYRFMAIQAVGSGGDEGGIAANGVAVAVTLSY